MAHSTLILASRSPRRAELLRHFGYTFVQVDSPFDDPPDPPPGDASQSAMHLARRKVLSLWAGGGISPDAVVLAADTVVVMPDGSLSGTPTSREQARTMIRRMLNAQHQVVTGVAILSPRSRTTPECFADTATVRIGDLPDTRLDSYLLTDQWRGKAGGYNLFERLADQWPITMTGDPGTITGLPMQKLGPYLGKLGITRLASAPTPGPTGYDKIKR